MKHLSSQEMDAMLSGAQTVESAEHVRSCVLCAEEVDSLRGVMGELRSMATSVAAREQRLAVPGTAVRSVPRMAWVTAALVLFTGVSVPMLRVKPEVKPVPVVEAMSDEALLSSIQSDLSNSVPESLLPLSSASNNAVEAKTEGGK